MTDLINTLLEIKTHLEFIQDEDNRGMFISISGSKLTPMKDHLLLLSLDKLNRVIKTLEER